jgi:propionyl-CoA carboxylase beta chain
MGSKQIGCDVNLAYPSAEIAVMAPESSARILYRNELTAAGENAAELYKQRVEELRSILSNPDVAAARGEIDAVIKPRETRGHVLRSLEQLRTKNVVRRWKKHSNIPL